MLSGEAGSQRCNGRNGRTTSSWQFRVVKEFIAVAAEHFGQTTSCWCLWRVNRKRMTSPCFEACPRLERVLVFSQEWPGSAGSSRQSWASRLILWCFHSRKTRSPLWEAHLCQRHRLNQGCASDPRTVNSPARPVLLQYLHWEIVSGDNGHQLRHSAEKSIRVLD